LNLSTSYITDALQAFVNNFDLEKKQALEMGSKAGEFALDAAQSMHSKAYRLALAITINVSHDVYCD